MNRPTLAPEHVSPSVADSVSKFHRSTVDQVAATVAEGGIVVVGMKQNPFVKKARKLLQDAGVEFTYLEFGSYTSQWKPRLAIKLWAGFPTFPMVFINGTLVGGYTELAALQAEGKLTA